MKKVLLFILMTAFNSFGFGQCKNGFSKSKFNGHKVKVPCINYEEANGLDFQISINDQSIDSLLVDVIFKNSEDVTKSIYWHDFADGWGVPLSFTLTVLDSNGKLIHDKFHFNVYMDSQVYYSKDQVNEKIDIAPDQTFQRAVRVWWPGIGEGDYTIFLNYGKRYNVLKSNELDLKITKRSKI